MSDADFERVRQAQAERNANKPSARGNGSNQRTQDTKASLTDNFDTELYGANQADKYAGYNDTIPADDEMDVEDGLETSNEGRLVGQYTATAEQIGEWAGGAAAEHDMIEDRDKKAQIASRETDYQRRRFARNLSPTHDGEQRTYSDVMQERDLEREEARVTRLIQEKQKEEIANGEEDDTVMADHEPLLSLENGDTAAAAAAAAGTTTTVDADTDSKPKRKTRWADADAEGEKPKKKSRWDTGVETRRTKWDVAPVADPSANITANVALMPQETVNRNAPISDEELDEMFPAKGYKILIAPPGFEPLRAPKHRVTPAAPTNTGGFMNQQSVDPRAMGKTLPTEIPGVGELAFFKQEDWQYFNHLCDGQDDNQMSVEELKTRKISRLLLKVKNGTPPMRKTALRQLTDNARSFGAGPLFDQILPLLMEKSLEDQERHLLVKVIDRVLYKLDELVRPYTHKILVVIEPLLIDQDYYARVEGREIISNLAKAAGLAHMISTMRPDIDHPDEYVRNTTARAFAVVAGALGIPTLLPFLKAVCRSKKAWEARHTGVKIIQQIPILMGCAVLPYLRGLIDCIADNLHDEQLKVRTVTSLALAALAEAAAPFGIESFDDILNPLWTEARKQRGRALAGSLKAVGFIVPLMDEEYSSYYVTQIMEILKREFQSPDEEMKKVVLKVISQCCNTPGVTGAYLKENMATAFFKSFWVRRLAVDTRIRKQVVETTVDLANKIGAGDAIEKIVGNMKDESEAYRRMTMETIEKIISNLGAADVDARLEERLVDGMLFSFQEQSVEDNIILTGFGTLVNGLSTRMKPYLPQTVSTILWRLNNKSPQVRQQAADLIGRIASVMKACDEEQLLIKLNLVLYEYLGEEYPEVLGSIINAMKQIVAVVDLHQLQPPVSDLVPRLTPVFRNRHEKVQEGTIELIGRVADRGPQNVSAREWMRVANELLEMLKAHKKSIRRAANNTFGYIAKAIGPSDVMATLLNNFRNPERQSRVCTAVALGIVAETCAPFTVLPALMNEYRVPELNVQNGVIKALAFLFEYIGEMSKDYVYAVLPLLEDALIDRDQVHRQTAAVVVKHIAIGCVGLGCEDAMLHLLNLLWPNIFETSPHVIDRIIEAIDAVRLNVGAGTVMNYTLTGLFHPARKVRTPYWRLYNEAYVQSADAMVPYYPVMLEEAGMSRSELMMVV